MSKMDEQIKKFWQMLENSQFIKSVNSVTGTVEEYPDAIIDMEETISINGEFDKNEIEDWLYENLKDKS